MYAFNPILKAMRNPNICLHKDDYANAHCSIIQNVCKLETVWKSIN